jgi:anti-sigma regulatory factor (Ser/Thr protein kinase)
MEALVKGPIYHQHKTQLMHTLGELSHTLALTVSDQSHIADTRRQVASLVHYCDFSENDNGRIALIITELATNILKHAGQGNILVQAVSASHDFTASDGLREHDADLTGIDILAMDKGPGMRDIQACMEDGYSTAGSSGTGLGAIARQSDAFHTYSIPGKGSVFHSRVVKSSAKPDADATIAFTIAGINIPYRGEDVSGDGWGCKAIGNSIALILADGIGHGEDAHLASKAAVKAFLEIDSVAPSEYLSDVHGHLAFGRGAAVSVATWDMQESNLTFCGIGNVAGSISDHKQGRKMMTFNGTLGHNIGKFHDLNYPITDDGVFVMHSDGLTANWTLEQYPGLSAQPAIVIAAVLYRDLSRHRDDACVVVAKKVH